jgi:hypothetical protein
MDYINDNIYKQKLKNATKDLANAQFLLDRTYNLVKDPKILINILKKVNDAYNESIAALVYRDRDFKLLPKFHDSTQSRKNIFIQRLVSKYKFNKNIIRTINELQELIQKHEQSPMEFSRNKEFVICDDKFKFKKVSLEDTKNHIKEAKSFTFKISKLINLNKLK